MQIRTGHRVEYDGKIDRVIRSIHVAGTLSFARGPRHAPGCRPASRSSPATMPARTASIATPISRPPSDRGKPGRSGSRHARSTASTPGHTALIRLTYVDGLDKQVLPCHRLLRRTHGFPRCAAEPHLGQARRHCQARVTRTVTLAEPVTGWRVGDRVLVTATRAHDRKNGSCHRGAHSSAPSTACGSRSTSRWSTSISAPATIAARSPT